MRVKFAIMKNGEKVAETVDSYLLDPLQASNLCNYMKNNYERGTSRQVDKAEYESDISGEGVPKSVTEISFIKFREV
jgi:hypothetical protein